MTSQVFIPTKVCTTCKLEKPTTEFSKNKSKKDGLRSQCKSCHSNWYQANKERHSETSKRWQSSNKEHVAEYKQAWRKENKSHIATYQKQWQQTNAAVSNAKTAKYRATKLQATPSWCEIEQINCLYEECQTITTSTGIQHHVDHIVPLQSELVCGLHCLANLQIIQAEENLSKNNRHWPDMP